MRKYDYVVIGSGFGGAVSALRLTEKGYSVLVLEAGADYRSGDFARTNWDLRKFLFFPRLGLRGIMRLDFFKGLTVLSGAGVGGGSLVYANTLIEPSRQAFGNASWPEGVGVQDWGGELAPHYSEARKMLGVTRAPHEFPSDIALKTSADQLGYGHTWHPVNVGVYFGTPGKEVEDPYFAGLGPKRSGCTLCGGCMVGCRFNAKNTLDKNYLYFAQKNGAEIRANAQVEDIIPQDDGYKLKVKSPGMFGSRSFEVKTQNVVVAAGVLGTMKLLLKCRDETKSLANLSKTLGSSIRTNSESIIGVRSRGTDQDYSQGVAIASSINPDEHTKIEAVRYPKGSNAMALMSMPLVTGSTILIRVLRIILYFLRHPIKFWAEYLPRGFAKETIILLVMQSLDSKMKFVWKRRLLSGFRKSLTADYSESGRPPVHIPIANKFAEKLAETVDGVAGGSISDVMGMSVTAHVLGGCPMGSDNDNSVIDANHEVHAYKGLIVVGGAAVPANLGVNPSLTITAMAERAMTKIAAKSEMDDIEQIDSIAA